MKLYDLINPRKLMEFFTFYSGGGSGGGGSSGVKYDNLESLYGVQSRAAGFMLDQAMPKISDTLSRSDSMVGEAMDGTLATRARNTAGADAAEAFGSNMDAINRNTAKFGAEFNPNRMKAMNNSAAVGGSLAKATAMNKAGQWAEDQKWNRNAGLYAQASGTGSGAMQGMSSAGAGLSGIAAQQNATDMANAQGYGQFGASLSYGLMKKDGGYISKPKKGFGARLANGGDAWAAYKAANPITVSGNSNRRGTNPGLAVAYGAAPMMLGAGLKDVMNLDGKGGKLGKLYEKWTSKGDKPAESQQTTSTMPAYAEDAPAQAGDISWGTDAGTLVGVGDSAQVGAEGTANVGALYDAGSVGTEAGAGGAMSAGESATALDMADTAFVANGGLIKKKAKGHGLRLAQGGGLFKAMPSVASMDASSSLALPKVTAMDDKPKALPKVAQQAAVGVSDPNGGQTQGYGETSNSDPDGFGKESPDNRHLAGKATMYGIGRWLGGSAGGAAGSALAEVIHPVMEPLTRTMIRTGDKAGGVSGAILLDPIGTSASGKYSPEQIAEGNFAIANGVPWAGKFLADGGESGEPDQRVDFKPGGDVQGPGTETSDSIPAWLSDGEIVHNADAVKLAGKDALLEINNAGRDVREGKATPQEAQQKIGQVMIQRGKQLAGGQSVKLADGGDAERLMREMEAKYGVSGKSAPQEQPQQPQQQQKVAEPAKPQTMADRLRSFVTGNLDGRMKAQGLKNGGCAVKLAGGGLAGVALGAGVQQWNRQQQLDQQDRNLDLHQQALDLQKQNAERAGKEFEWKTADRAKQDALGTTLADIAAQEGAGDVSGYIAGKEDEAKATAALNGYDYQPLTQEQRDVIARAPGLGKMTPHLRYELDLQRANAFHKAGDVKMAEELRGKATQQATGDFMRSLMSGDYRSAGKLYNLYPNDHTIAEMRAGQKNADGEDMVTIVDDKGNEHSVSHYDLMTGALASMNPQAAAQLMAQDKKLDAYMKRVQLQQEGRLAQIAARNAAGGTGKTGKGEEDPTLKLLDREKFNKAMMYKEDEAPIANSAYSFYTQLAAANRRGGDGLPAATDAELQRLADDMARGKKKPVVDFDNGTMQFRHGVMDEGGNLRPLRSGPVRGDNIDTVTKQPFHTADAIRAKELGGLDYFAKQDPKGYTQAAELAQSKSAYELQQMANDPRFARYANAAQLMQRYADAAPTDKKPAADVDRTPRVDARRERYDKWLGAKNELDKIKRNAASMSPDAAEVYLSSRVPQLEEIMKQNENYFR